MVAEILVRGRRKVFGPVLLSPAFPGLENGVVVLWGGFWGAESEFEVRLVQFGRPAPVKNVAKRGKRAKVASKLRRNVKKSSKGFGERRVRIRGPFLAAA